MIGQELRPPVALTIAGSDSGGGAGIQADLRTFAFHGVHGTSALTCVTAQNTLGVTRVDALPVEAVVAQIQAVVSDIGVQAVKTGMLLNASIIGAVVEQIQHLALPNLVVDPVMVSRTGSRLLDEQAVEILKTQLLPLALIATPNRYEAEILSGLSIHDQQDRQRAAENIYALGCQAVLIKGGGMAGSLKATDLWFDGQQFLVLSAEALPTPHTHGTGCTLAAAIAAQLAQGQSPLAASKAAKHYVTQAIAHALAIGHGQGPIGHFFPIWGSQPQLIMEENPHP
ncbi:MAG: bifunctional hydroxymethylpyrimidine kinase/phosphomethylpyrimidine kinase [Cyanobacteriota bacterium]|nr:bifunctional hydroxymethylpyrimidine kinase/phosphomethylpyrimidine kinase [Cyanobacteriota bacterium]